MTTFREQLEAHGNEADVRDRLARGLYNSQHRGVAEDWLRGMEEARAREVEARREAREVEALELARQSAAAASVSANAAAESAAAARKQVRWAVWAAVIAAAAALVAAKDDLRGVVAFIFGQ